MDWTRFYDEIWLIDFEFSQPAGERPSPACLVGLEYKSNRKVRIWQDELLTMGEPPFPVGDRTLVVAYYAVAELSCFLELGWPQPTRILDLFTEFRCRTSGLSTPGGASLLGAMMYFGLDAMDATEKESMRELAIRGGPYSADERQALLEYCESDVTALRKLFPAMAPDIDLPRALLRGRYMAAVARMERAGVPLDTEALAAIKNNWVSIKEQLIARIDQDYGVYDGVTFKEDRWAAWLAAHNIPWATLESSRLDLSEDTFRQVARSYPLVAPIHELRTSMSQLRLNDLPVGRDGRNRCMLSAFRSKTSRNQPSNSKFIFGPSVWLRSLIRPRPNTALAYIDYSQQELAIAAALSCDQKMQQAYLSGDFYLAFAKMANAVPANATKKSHPAQRDQFKVVSLGVLYGLSDWGLARKLNQPLCYARELLQKHKDTFRQFWKWSDAIRDQAVLTGKLYTVFGWPIHVDVDTKANTLRNFPMQANGAEMLRLACCTATEAGNTITCPVHDAVLIECAELDVDAAVRQMQDHMKKASEIVLNGFPLKTDSKIVRYPKRYMDERGEKMWQVVNELCGRIP